MNRRSVIKNGFLAALAASIIPIPKMSPTYHFIGIGSNGGRILESMYRYGARGKYTWITGIDDVSCGVPDLELIISEVLGNDKHAFYYGGDQVHQISFPHHVMNGPIKPSMTILLSDFRGCYWSMVSIPLLVDLLEKQNQLFRCIMAVPMRYTVLVNSQKKSLNRIRSYPGRIIEIIDETTHEPAEDTGRARLFNTYNKRFYLEFEALRGLIEYNGVYPAEGVALSNTKHVSAVSA